MLIECGFLEINSKKFSAIMDFHELHNYNHLANNPRWALFVESVYGHRAYYLEVKSGGNTLAYAVGNLFQISSFGSKSLILGSFLDYGVMMYSQEMEVRQIELIDTEILSSMHPSSMIVKGTYPLEETSKQSQAVIDLSNHSISSIQKHITSRARNDLRQFDLASNSLQVDNNKLAEFYRLYVKRMKEFGTPAHSMRFFTELLKAFDSKVITSYDEYGRASASSLSVCENGSWFHLYAVSDRSRRKGNPGDQILWEEIKMSIEREVQSFWLGRSVRNSNIEKYKEKWNPKFSATCERIGSRKNAKLGFQEVDKDNTKSNFAYIWSKLPTRITNLSNSSVRKYIP
jgi:hypothetical protein